MAWAKAGSTTLTTSGDDLDITSMTASKFNQILAHEIPTGDADIDLTFNDNTGSNYARRTNYDGGTDSTAVSQADLAIGFNPANDIFQVMYWADISGEEKLGIQFSCKRNTAGAGTAPRRSEQAMKFTDTSARITRVDYNNTNTGSYDTDSNITVLGSDITPAAAIPFAENVQAGSRAEITDTRKMYHFEAGSPIETLDSTNGTTDWNVTNGGSDITIDTSNNEIDITGTGTKSGYYDLGTSVSASAWVLRFKITSSGSPSGNPIFWVGMLDVNTINSRTTSVNGISLMMYTGGNYKLSMKNGSAMDSGGTQTDMSPTVSADTTTRYVEIVRNGSNAILTFYNSDTYLTSIGTVTVAITGSAFRYLCAMSYWEGSGRTYSLSNVKFYNGATTPVMPDVWTEEGT